MADIPEHEIVALLAEPPDRFVEARTSRVKELKAAGQKDVAAELAKVRKPSRIVWAVGELGRRHPDEAADAVEVAADLETATSGGGGDVRALLTRFREAIAALTQRSDGIEGIDGSQLGLALRSVLGDADAREAWADGRLLDLPAEGAFGGPSDLGALSAAPPRPKPKPKPKAKAGRGAAAPDDDRAEREQEEADRLAREAEEEARRRRDAVEKASEEVDAAREDRSAVADEVDDLESRIADLTRELDAARSRLRAAEQAEQEATGRLGQARAALDEVEASRQAGA
jgi:hypothetical protein